MLRAASWAAPCLLVLLAVGCDPFETEVTIAPDGSGKMSQRCHLSPVAYVMLRDVRVGSGGRVQLMNSEERAKAWSDAHADGPVKLLSYSCKRDDAGWRKIACEVSFTDLSQLAATEWGWPLQFSASAKDGRTELRFDDPARGVGGTMARREMRPDRADETAAMLQMGAALAAGMRVRVTVNLPVAVAVEGAQLSADGKTVAYDVTIGEGTEKFRAWLDGKPASILLPADGPVKPFAQPPAPSTTRPAEPAAAKPAGPKSPPVDTKDFEFRLNSVSVTRQFSYNAERPGEQPSRHDRINIGFGLYGPVGVDFVYREPGGSRNEPGEDLLSTVKDGDGNDLRTVDTRVSFNLYEQMPQARRDEPGAKAQYGSLNLSLAPPSGGSKMLALVDGYVVAERVAETDKVEVKPLKDSLQRDIETPVGVVRFTEMGERTIKYVVTPTTWDRFRPGKTLRLKGVGPDGAAVDLREASRNGDGKKWTITQDADRALPQDVSLVLTYPSKLERVKLPFKLKDIPLP